MALHGRGDFTINMATVFGCGVRTINAAFSSRAIQDTINHDRRLGIPKDFAGVGGSRLGWLMIRGEQEAQGENCSQIKDAVDSNNDAAGTKVFATSTLNEDNNRKPVLLSVKFTIIQCLGIFVIKRNSKIKRVPIYYIFAALPSGPSVAILKVIVTGFCLWK